MQQVATRVSSPYRLAESGLRVPACASLLSGMETSPSQGVEVLVLADQDFEDMFLAPGGHPGQAGQSRSRSTIWYQDHPVKHSHNDSINSYFARIRLCYLHVWSCLTMTDNLDPILGHSFQLDGITQYYNVIDSSFLQLPSRMPQFTLWLSAVVQSQGHIQGWGILTGRQWNSEILLNILHFTIKYHEFC